MPNITTAIPDVPLPAGVVISSEQWQDWDDGDRRRVIYGAEKVILDAKGEKIAETRTWGIQNRSPSWPVILRGGGPMAVGTRC